MEQRMDKDILFMLKQKKRRKFWSRALSVMMCVVVFCTTYALILPAITKETDTFCGIEAHTHTEDCYDQTLLCESHVHDEACFEMHSEQICGLEETEGHTHGETCVLQMEKVLNCELEETEGHTHTEACGAAEQVLSCGLEETTGHTHTGDCTSKTLNCSLPEDEAHTHSDSCYTTEYICGLEEGTGHSHTEACYTSETVYVCGMEEIAGHQHGDTCWAEVTAYSCGLQETEPHVHTEACFETTQVQICTIETDPEHEHTESCYDKQLICELEEHAHSLPCYADPSVDLETAAIWEASLPTELSGVYAKDVLAIAKSQLGYTESVRNYQVSEDGEAKGYTRYGAWYGIPYGDWCAMFVSFCLDYAGVEEFPLDANCPNWINNLKEKNMYAEAEGYIPNPGDIIFFDWNANGLADHVGLVEEYIPATEHSTDRIQTIEGNSGNIVRYNTYNLADPTILGYGQLPSRYFEEVPNDAENISSPADANLLTQMTSNMETPSVFTRSRMMMVASPSTRAITREITGTIDMENLIDTVTVYRKLNGAWVEVESGDTITQGEDLKFTIHYTVDGMVLSDAANTLVYTIPSNLSQVVSSTGLVYNDTKEAVGTFVIDADTNTIVITFSDEYVTNNQLNKAIEGSISFYATVEKITQEGDETTDIVFSDKVVIEMEVIEKEDMVGDVNVSKSITQVNGTEITYQVVVTSETGTFSSVTLTDEMTGGMKIQESTVSVKNKNGRDVSYEVDNASTETNYTITLPQMNAGDAYTITYTAKLHGTVEGYALVNNKATASSTNNLDIEINDFAEVDHTFRALHKTGEQQEDGSIRWTIVINEDKLDISGAVLRDVIKDTDGTESAYTGTATLTDSRGNSQEITFPYTFPQGSSDTYTITYTTNHDMVVGVNSVNNWVGLTYGKDDVEFEGIAGVGIGTNNPIVKEGEILSVDGQTGKISIQWTATVDTSNGALPAGSFIDDMMTNGQYMTYAQLQEMFANIEAAVAPYGVQIARTLCRDFDERYYFDEELDAADADNQYYFIRVYFDKEIPKGARFSFSYTVTADAPPDVGYFYNAISMNDGEWYNVPLKYDTNQPFITKFGLDANNGDQLVYYDTEMDYDDLFEVDGEKTLWWRVRVQIPANYSEAIVVKEILPEGMELAYTVAMPWGSNGDGDLKIGYPDENGYGLFDWWGTHFMDMQVTTTETGDQIVTYTIRDYMASTLAGSVMDLNVVCKFRDDFGWGDLNDIVVQVPFTNTATVESPDGDQFGTANHSFTVKYNKSKEIVSKSGVLNQQNELEYSVVLNENARNLDPDEGTIKVQDVLSYVSPAQWPIKLYLKPGSVNVYDYTDGVKGDLITTARYTYTENAEGNGDITYTHTLDLVLPDSQAMLLEYVYIVDGVYNENYSYDMINTCILTGIADGSIQDDVQIEVKVYDTNAEANFNGVYIYKVDAYDNKLYLPGAVFNLYTWNNQTKQYVRVKHPNTDGSSEDHYAFTTNQEGYLMLNDETMEAVAYNTAYYITEVIAPSGYFMTPDPYYFYIYNEDTEQNPYNFPEGFNGDKLNTGALIYYYNEPATTEIVIHKKWQDHNNNPITVKADQVESVSFELWQKLDGAENSDKLYGTYTVTPDANGFWERTITDLPKGIVNPADGTKGTLYQYYIKEVSVPNYDVSYEYDDGNDATIDDSDGINSGIIIMTNRQKKGYELPETGGAGTQMYTTAGLLLMLTSAAYLMYIHKKRRKEVA